MAQIKFMPHKVKNIANITHNIWVQRCYYALTMTREINTNNNQKKKKK